MAKAKLAIMGEIVVVGLDGNPDIYDMALLITFDNSEELRQAIREGKVEFNFIGE